MIQEKSFLQNIQKHVFLEAEHNTQKNMKYGVHYSIS